MWYAKTKHLMDAGRVQMMGIVEEQHSDRARLFLQWKRMKFPILIDGYDLLQVPYVPITVLVDEHGVVQRVVSPGEVPDDLEASFVDRAFDPPTRSVVEPAEPDVAKLAKLAGAQDTADAWRRYAVAAAVGAKPTRIDDVITAFETAVARDPTDGFSHFRAGVALRHRHDSPARRPGDFQRAVDHWVAALRIDPNNYIWRRRIQQYGPRLDKPYPFYDWVEQARTDIVARGETPSALTVEPRGSELAAREPSFAAAALSKDPDPDGKVIRDDGLIGAEVAVVPSVIDPGEAARVHVVLRPDRRRLAHWNNEAGDLAIWMQPPAAWQADAVTKSIPNPPHAATQELRQLEFELRAPADAKPGRIRVPAYALYYVCEDQHGTCLYRRQDLPLTLTVGHPRR